VCGGDDDAVNEGGKTFKTFRRIRAVEKRIPELSSARTSVPGSSSAAFNRPGANGLRASPNNNNINNNNIRGEKATTAGKFSIRRRDEHVRNVNIQMSRVKSTAKLLRRGSGFGYSPSGR